MTVDPRTVIRDKVAERIFAFHAKGQDFPSDLRERGSATQDYWDGYADAAIAAHLEALEQAARIDTVEQLAEALPGTVIRVGDGPGGIYEKDRAGSWGYDAWGDEETAIMTDAEGDFVRVLYRADRGTVPRADVAGAANA